MNMKEIKEMLQLMQEHDLAELEIDKDGLKMKFKKCGQERYDTQIITAPRAASNYSPAPAQTQSGNQQTAPQASTDPGLLIKSPMVGTFYGSPAPDQPAYVSAGSKFKTGDVLCIVEAMKLMNEIKAEFSGEILEVLIKNGQPIEFDQPLFRIKKD